MAVTLGSLCEKAGYLYGMRVIAGKEGMTNIVQWVHSVEDIEVSDFLHGGELIFSTGIANKGQDWLLPFVKNLIAKNVSGLVLNIGPYIKGIPSEVISYCNEKKFPLMDIPWKTRIVDISRDFCNQIISNERKEERCRRRKRCPHPGDPPEKRGTFCRPQCRTGCGKGRVDRLCGFRRLHCTGNV